VEKNVLIMSDEIYEHLLYDGAKVKSVASFSPAHQEHTIIVHGFAKAWSMTGWRLGFLAAPEPIAKAIDAVQSHSTSNPTSFAQKGGVAALTGPQDHLKIWLAEYDKRRRYAHAKLNSIPGITCVNAKGAFYLFPNIPGPASNPPTSARNCWSRKRSPPSRHRLRRGRLHPFELRHQHGQHRERPGAH
jgi:aspartate aminotransferase